MTLDADFSKITPSILEKLIENPKLIDVLFNPGFLPNTEEYWQEFTSIPEALEKIIADINLIEAESEILYANYENGESIFIQNRRSWHGINILLTGDYRTYDIPFLVIDNPYDNPYGDNLPLVNAIMGGTKIGNEAPYPYDEILSYLRPDEVKQVAEALSKISAESLEKRLEQEVMRGNYIYPIEDLADDYNELVNFYQEAAAQEKAVLLSIEN